MQLNPEEAARLAADLLDLDDPHGTDPEDGTVGVPASAMHLFRGGRLGNYRIRRFVGSGGMGEVYEAEQDSPRRRVALKVVRSHMLCGELRRRFEHEVRILGSLHHPGIAQIYEAGQVEPTGGIATEDDAGGEAGTAAATTPFFAMEYVEGETLTKHAAARHLGVRERLELFLRVCQAVEHAHQRGIIHRDLKPANILVACPSDAGTKTGSSLTDHIGQPKVLDFGVARATDADVTVTSVHTEVGRLVGTLAYMSPEQASGNPNELDTRSDVYALGVVLYELLSGKLPYEVKGDVGARVAQALRVIKEVDPTPLSSIDRVFRGDLETIVGKALEKERERRYQSVGELAGDIRRYLTDEPIVARRTGGWYELKKLARRNRGFVIAVSVAFAGLGVGTGIATAYAMSERAAREQMVDLAEREKRSRLQAEADKKEAERKASSAAAVTEYFRTMFSVLGPTAEGRDVKVSELLIAAQHWISKDVGAEPEASAILRNTLAQSYQAIGRMDLAEETARSSVSYAAQHLGEGTEHWVIAQTYLADILVGQAKFAEAMPYIDKLMQSEWIGSGLHPSARVSVLAVRANAFSGLGRPHEAIACIDEAIKTSNESSLSGELRYMLPTLLGAALRDLGRMKEAEEVLNQAAAEQERDLGEDNITTISTKIQLGIIRLKMDRSSEAAPIFAECLELLRHMVPEHHPLTLTAMNNLADALRMTGKPVESERLFREVLSVRERTMGFRNAQTLSAANNLILTLCDLEQLEEAEHLARRVYQVRKEDLGDQHPQTMTSLHNIGSVLYSRNKFVEALPVFQEVVELRTRFLGEERRETLGSVSFLAQIHHKLGNDDEALKHWRSVLEHRGDMSESEPRIQSVRRGIGEVLVARGEYAAAETELLIAWRAVAQTTSGGSARQSKLAQAICDLYTAWGKPEQASEYRRFMVQDVPR